ncbi:glycosyl hydrolase [Fimbriimonas ginsengisoli]|uniref:Glycosyl hydrolase family 26 n=1 Tax=Fimbriimonas ginsengisoli Gsoil 348 TaxID=661478 RepID=A0A068NS43_FIMGI|nr:glycosyl hydrolase [Fimbriimonas ginsengisoli]AIE86162.1 Glycosyl hydrolase family 26 [Fimbriimonas ginsengisoli Gsoil 348]
MLTLALLLGIQTPRISIRLEAENGTLSGPVQEALGTGYSGTGYVTGFTHGSDWVTWRYPAHPGIYDVAIGYRAGSQKGFDLRVNGHSQTGMFAATGERFGVAEAGKVELVEGDNEIALGKGWGYYDIDYIELRPSKPFPAPKRPPLRLSDPLASPHTRDLMRRLIGAYGRRTFTGQYELPDSDFVRTKVGVTPAIIGGDFMTYSPSRAEHGEKPSGITETLIDEAKKGSIVTLSWHWNAPVGLLDKKYKDAQGREIDASWYKGFYTNASTFDVAKAMADPASEERRLLLRDIDVIAVELKKFAALDIPVLWRPLHEAEGGWFWWGAKGAEPTKQLWRLLREQLIGKHGLHNLIWVYNSVNPSWYPGDDAVDIMAIDRYPGDRTDPLTGDWSDLQRRFDGKKLLAIAEFPGAPDIERMHRFGARWSFFVSWVGDLGARGTDPALLERTYKSKRAVNRK